MNIKEKIKLVATYVREVMETRYGTGTDLCGYCIEASEMIVYLLYNIGINTDTVEGWCIYEDDSSCSDRCYDEHTWVETEDGTYIDVTADQFNTCMYNKLKPIIIGKKPKCMVLDEPEDNWLE